MGVLFTEQSNKVQSLYWHLTLRQLFNILCSCCPLLNISIRVLTYLGDNTVKALLLI